MKNIEKYIPGFEGRYVVGSHGYIRKVGKKVKNFGTWNNRRDMVVHITDNNGKSRMFSVSRLVAEAFLDNPDGRTQVDHINTDRRNNRADNLRWAWPKENNANSLTIVHRHEPGLFATKNQGRRPCVARLPNGDVIHANSMAEMAMKLGCAACTVKRCCEGEQKAFRNIIIEYNPYKQFQLF